MVEIPRIFFNNGHSCPVIGLGTWQSKGDEVVQALKDAINVGYRHIDCANRYGNEEDVGTALAAVFKEGVLKREDMFITSKIRCTYLRPELVETAIKKTLKSLGLKYLDLYLIHWPQAYNKGNDPMSVNDVRKAIPVINDYVDTWKAMEALVDKGLTKSIGLSNFNKRQISRVVEAARIKPAVLQIEVHPYLNQVKLIDYCTSLGIRVTAYSPLGSPDRPWAKPTDPQLLTDSRLKLIADKYGKSVGQLLIRYAVERGLIVIPKSGTKHHIEENIAAAGFQLASDDVKNISSLECNFRYVHMGDFHHPDYPFHDEY